MAIHCLYISYWNCLDTGRYSLGKRTGFREAISSPKGGLDDPSLILDWVLKLQYATSEMRLPCQMHIGKFHLNMLGPPTGGQLIVSKKETGFWINLEPSNMNIASVLTSIADFVTKAKGTLADQMPNFAKWQWHSYRQVRRKTKRVAELRKMT